MERRLAAILVADVVGYSSLIGRDEAAALGVIRDLKDEFLEPTVCHHGGEVLKRTGDGWIVIFSSVIPAIDCAMETQQRLVGNPKIKLRIGAHIGEIVLDETDFHGASVNVAHRLETEAPPGGLMISQDLHRQMGSDLADKFADAGMFRLKNIEQPVACFQWRPQRQGSAAVSTVPCIAVENLECAPDTSDTHAVAADLREQLLQRLARRTGSRVVDESIGGAEESDYLLRGRLRLGEDIGRFTLTLIVREDGAPIWSQNFQGETSDALKFCDDLIARADAGLRLQINAFDAERIAHLADDELSISELRSRVANLFYKTGM